MESGQASLVDEVKRRPDVAERLGSRSGGDRHIRRLEQPFRSLVSDLLCVVSSRLEGRVEHRGFVVMERQDLGQRLFALAGDRLAPSCGLSMKARALNSRQGAVGDLLDEDVAERVAVAFGGSNEVAIDQVLAKMVDLRRLAKLQRRHARRAKRPTEDAAQLQHASFFYG